MVKAAVQAPHLNPFEQIEDAIGSLQAELRNHSVYELLVDAQAVRIFMEHHCFAVMDFMCLLKSLQQRLTVVSVPWFPPANMAAAHFINEIVVAEESDVNQGGGFISHYEMYLNAMRAAGADTARVEEFVELVRNRQHYRRALMHAEVPVAAQRFVKTTMQMCLVGKNHEVASFFVFGRENLIPEMFTEIVRRLDADGAAQFGPLLYYLERHIEIDGDEHGPMARRMIESMCGDEPRRWRQTEKAAIKALSERKRLWDAIETAIRAARA